MAFSKEGPKWQKRGQKRTNFDPFSEKVLQRDQKTKRDQLVITGFYRWKNKFSSILNDGLLFEKMRDNLIHQRKNQKALSVLVLLAERSCGNNFPFPTMKDSMGGIKNIHSTLVVPESSFF